MSGQKPGRCAEQTKNHSRGVLLWGSQQGTCHVGGHCKLQTNLWRTTRSGQRVLVSVWGLGNLCSIRSSLLANRTACWCGLHNEAAEGWWRTWSSVVCWLHSDSLVSLRLLCLLRLWPCQAQSSSALVDGGIRPTSSAEQRELGALVGI